jgi:hypothetical protein
MAQSTSGVMVSMTHSGTGGDGNAELCTSGRILREAHPALHQEQAPDDPNLAESHHGLEESTRWKPKR